MARTVQLVSHDACCPIKLSYFKAEMISGRLIANQI